jgi:hypothetical protein
MSKSKHGGPAFPHAFETLSPDRVGVHHGMALRDYFAAKAMQGLIARGDGLSAKNSPTLYEAAFAIADAMLEARGRA